MVIHHIDPRHKKCYHCSLILSKHPFLKKNITLQVLEGTESHVCYDRSLKICREYWLWKVTSPFRHFTWTKPFILGQKNHVSKHDWRVWDGWIVKFPSRNWLLGRVYYTSLWTVETTSTQLHKILMNIILPVVLGITMLMEQRWYKPFIQCMAFKMNKSNLCHTSCGSSDVLYSWIVFHIDHMKTQVCLYCVPSSNVHLNMLFQQIVCHNARTWIDCLSLTSELNHAPSL